MPAVVAVQNYTGGIILEPTAREVIVQSIGRLSTLSWIILDSTWSSTLPSELSDFRKVRTHLADPPARYFLTRVELDHTEPIPRVINRGEFNKGTVRIRAWMHTTV